jgi:hypothetical protein
MVRARAGVTRGSNQRKAAGRARAAAAAARRRYGNKEAAEDASVVARS